MNSFQARLLLVTVLSLSSACAFAAEIRLGIIGLDTSHVTAFTELLNNPSAKDHVPGARVVAAFKGGSADIPRRSPVPAAETIELFAFMEAADESKRQGGKTVSLTEVMAKARAKK